MANGTQNALVLLVIYGSLHIPSRAADATDSTSAAIDGAVLHEIIVNLIPYWPPESREQFAAAIVEILHESGLRHVDSITARKLSEGIGRWLDSIPELELDDKTRVPRLTEEVHRRLKIFISEESQKQTLNTLLRVCQTIENAAPDQYARPGRHAAYWSHMMDHLALWLEAAAREPLWMPLKSSLPDETLQDLEERVAAALSAYDVTQTADHRLNFLANLGPQVESLLLEYLAVDPVQAADQVFGALSDRGHPAGVPQRPMGLPNRSDNTEQIGALAWLLMDTERAVSGRIPVGPFLDMPRVVGHEPTDASQNLRITVVIHRMTDGFPVGERAILNAYIDREGSRCLQIDAIASRAYLPFVLTSFSNNSGFRFGYTDEQYEYVAYMNNIYHLGELNEAMGVEEDAAAATAPFMNELHAIMLDLKTIRAAVLVLPAERHVRANADEARVELKLRSSAFGEIARVRLDKNRDHYLVFEAEDGRIVGDTSWQADWGQGEVRTVTRFGLERNDGRIVVDRICRTEPHGVWQVVHRKIYDGGGLLLYEFKCDPIASVSDREKHVIPPVLLGEAGAEREREWRRSIATRSRGLTERLNNAERAEQVHVDVIRYIADVAEAPVETAPWSAARYAIYYSDILWKRGEIEPARELFDIGMKQFRRVFTEDELYHYAKSEFDIIGMGRLYVWAKAIHEDVRAQGADKLSEVSGGDVFLQMARSHWWAVKTGQLSKEEDGLKYYREFLERYPNDVGSVLARLRIEQEEARDEAEE